jgi:hypothetical protein
MDDDEALAEVRARAQHAMSRARLVSDPQLKKQWVEVADAWSVLLARFEATKHEPMKDKSRGPKKSGRGGGPGPATK